MDFGGCVVGSLFSRPDLDVMMYGTAKMDREKEEGVEERAFLLCLPSQSTSEGGLSTGKPVDKHLLNG